MADLGTKVEIKNLNSFRFVEAAFDHEIVRQQQTIESGERIIQETRLWDPATGGTVSMRGKEDAHDYRYFPEPDLPPVVVESERLRRLVEELPELPAARRHRLMATYELAEIDVVHLTEVAPGLDAYFEETVGAGADPKAVKNWLLGVVRAKMNEGDEDAEGVRRHVTPDRLAGLIALVERGTISASIAKDVFETMFASGRTAADIVQSEGLTQIDDESAILILVRRVLAEHADAVSQYRAGKTAALGFLVGQIMKAAAGKANPKRVNELLKHTLEE